MSAMARPLPVRERRYLQPGQLFVSAVPAVFRLAVDGLRGLGTCVLVGSARDRGEQFDLDRLAQPPGRVVVTDGVRGGTGYQALPPPASPVDSYGAGDTFAAGLLYGIADGLAQPAALALGARLAAESVTWRGAYPPQSRRPSW